ncbi:reverse transcriptase domain-containing protein [Rhodovibrio sodomensis]|uniref:reverse transcriptase domain-containing protein n=1 Tax=Rhodovibrio sodomensis TaxID=1088 RepID=UPI001905A557|nr:reverse transcriptase domain-containing protein [Rhodovibrio sodomensis]
MFGKTVHISIPPELADEASLLTYLGLGADELKKIRYYRASMYHNFPIGTDGRKRRIINAPDARLKFLQRRISDKLADIYRRRNPVHGFVAERSVKTNALAHMRRKYVVNIDLANFFPTISQNRVEGMLLSLNLDASVAQIIGIICCNKGILPQGAPSSPLLSNMICFKLDKGLMNFSKEARCIYTRYADDLTFSSFHPPAALFETAPPPAGRLSSEQLASQLRRLIIQNGFSINERKLHYADRDSRRLVTGLKINQILNVDRRYVRNIRAALFSVERNGIKGAEKTYHKEHGGRGSLAEHLRGKISFLSHIKGQHDPVVRGLAIRFNQCFPHWPITVTPTKNEVRDRAVWVVENETSSQGTAFFLRGVGLVTAAHCVEGVNEVDIFHPSKPSNKFKAKIFKREPHLDLAVLSHAIPENEYFELSKS